MGAASSRADIALPARSLLPERLPVLPVHEGAVPAELIEPYTRAALAEVDLWADAVGPAEATSVYVGGGTPTLALEAVSAVLARMRERFRLTGDVCIETNPADVDEVTVAQLHEAGVALVSLGVQSFRPESLKVIGRRYTPEVAEKALSLLADSDFASVNADIMFALPGQSTADVIADLEHAAELGADQITTYPLFTFPYTAVGEYLHLAGVRLPDLHTRHEHYRAISRVVRGQRLRAGLGVGLQARRRAAGTPRSLATATSASDRDRARTCPMASRSTPSISPSGSAPWPRAGCPSHCACRSRAR